MTSIPVSIDNEPSNEQFRYINVIEEGATDLRASSVASHCISKKGADNWLHLAKRANGENLCLSLPSPVSIVGHDVVLEFMKDVKPTCTVVDSYGPEESLPDSNEPNDSYDGLSASQTSDGEALSDSDDQIGSRLDTYLHSDLSTRPKQIEAIDEGIPTSTREPGLFRYDCSTEAASIIDAGVGVRSPGLIDGWEPRSTVTFNVTDTAGQEIAILDHASNSVGKLRDPHHDQKRELDSICSINLGLNYKIYR